MELGKMVCGKILEWKSENNISNSEIAEALGESGVEIVDQYLSGVKQLPNTKFIKVAEMMNLSLDNLLDDSDGVIIRVNGEVSTFSGQLGIDRVVGKIESGF